MPSNFEKLNLNVPFLKEEISSRIKHIKTTVKFRPELILHEKLISLVESLGTIKIVNCMIIYYPVADTPSLIHIDDAGVFDQTNLNYVIGGAGSKVFWYEPEPEYSGDIVTTPWATRPTYDINKMIVSESTEIIGACLFQSGTPHNVINPIEDRYCINVKLKNINSEWLNWNSALQLFNRYIVKE
jgi:hypothetical protein